MAAVIQLYPLDSASAPRSASAERRARSAHPAGGRRSGPPQLRVVHGGRSAQVQQMQRVYIARRVAVVVAAAVLALVIVSAGGAVLREWSASTTDSSVPIALSSPYQVQEGDTLWGIARSVDPHSDPRDVIDRIARENSIDGVDLRSGSLQVGQELNLPS